MVIPLCKQASIRAEAYRANGATISLECSQVSSALGIPQSHFPSIRDAGQEVVWAKGDGTHPERMARERSEARRMALVYQMPYFYHSILTSNSQQHTLCIK